MLAADIIKRVREIELRTGRAVADVLAGEYGSVFKGAGLEFDEVRPYIPGDDVRTIDWNVTARAGAPHVKRFIEERQLTLMLMADVSASQDYGSVGRSKREAAAELCALLAFSAIRNDDKVGLVLFHGGVEQYVPPRKGMRHALRVIREVLAAGTAVVPVGQRESWWRRWRARRKRSDAANPLRRQTNLGEALEFFASVTKRRSVCFVVSDFLDTSAGGDSQAFERALAMANRRHDVIAVLLTDPAELQMPAAGLVALADAEGGGTRVVDTSSRAFQTHVRAMAEERVQSLGKRLGRAGIDFIHVDVGGTLVDPLVRFFKMRERRSRR